MRIYQNWKDFPMSEWRWKDFTPREMACRGTGMLIIDFEAMVKLQALRDLLGRPLIVTSAGRSPEHNKAVGGKPGSFHLKGRAFDIRMDNHDPYAFRNAAEAVGFTGFGGYRDQNFMHIDTGPVRQWGQWWHAGRSPVDLPMEQMPPKPLMKDKGAQGASALVAAPMLREASNLIKETGGFLEGLHPYAQIGSALLVGAGVILIALKLRERL